MIKLFPRSLAQQVSVMIACLGFAVVLLSMGIMMFHINRLQQEHLEQIVTDQTTVVSEVLTQAILTEDIYALYSLCASIQSRFDWIDNVMVQDRAGQYITDARVMRDLIQRQSAPSRQRIITKALKAEGETVGFVLFSLNLGVVRGELWMRGLRIFLVNLGMVLMVAWVAILGIRRVIQPLNQLSDDLEQRSATEDFEEPRLPPWAAREIVVLRQRFLETIDRLEVQQRTLARQEKQAAIGTMAAGLAHEIKNPVMTMDLLCHRMHRTCEDPELTADLEVMRKESTRLVRWINEFLDFAKPVNVNWSDIPLSDLLEDLRMQVTRRFGSGLHLEIETPMRAVVRGDRDKLLQVLFNLVQNAREAGAGWVRVKANRRGPWIQIHVRDDGPGIKPEIRKSIFLPFFTTKAKGTGLGLAMCETLLEAMDGSIVYNEKHEPSTAFLLELRGVDNVANPGGG